MHGPSLLEGLFRRRTASSRFGRWWLVYCSAMEDGHCDPLEWLDLVRDGGFDAVDRVYIEAETIGG